MDSALNLDFVLKIFILGALPWLWLSWYTSIYKDHFNSKFGFFATFFASLFSLCIFLYLYNSSPDDFKFMPSDHLLFLILTSLIITYMILLFFDWERINRGIYREKANELFIFFQMEKKAPFKSPERIKKIVCLQLVLILYYIQLYFKTVIFISVFSVLAFAFAKNTVYQNYVTVRGNVMNQENKPLTATKVKLFANDRFNAAMITSTDSLGNFTLTIPKKSIDALKTIAFYTTDGDSSRRKFETQFISDTLKYTL